MYEKLVPSYAFFIFVRFLELAKEQMSKSWLSAQMCLYAREVQGGGEEHKKVLL